MGNNERSLLARWIEYFLTIGSHSDEPSQAFSKSIPLWHHNVAGFQLAGMSWLMDCIRLDSASVTPSCGVKKEYIVKWLGMAYQLHMLVKRVRALLFMWIVYSTIVLIYSVYIRAVVWLLLAWGCSVFLPWWFKAQSNCVLMFWWM